MYILWKTGSDPINFAVSDNQLMKGIKKDEKDTHEDTSLPWKWKGRPVRKDKSMYLCIWR